MFEIDKITCYKTKDGELFETYEEAKKHNKLLIKKEVPFEEFSIYDSYGTPLFAEEMSNLNYVWYVYAATDNGAKFLEYFTGTEIKPLTFYRYDVDEKRWISQKEDLDRLNSDWENILTFEEARC